jgi:fructokinase
MRKVIGIGETILDIIFQNNQPSAAVPGGSVFNGVVSLARAGVDVSFVSETGNDRVGETILNYMRESGMTTEFVSVFPDGKSPVSLAYLDENNDASYIFYKDYPRQRLDVTFPKIERDDILIFGSYFAINPVIRDKVYDLLTLAKEHEAIIYYDPNFRASHKSEAMKLAATIIENLEFADIVRGSSIDFDHLYSMQDVDKVYRDRVQFYCPNFICTQGAGNVALRTKSITKDYPMEPIKTVSTVGAGDNFNAGIIYGMLKYDIRRDDIYTMGAERWDKVIEYGQMFAAEACKSLNNSISHEFAQRL